MSLPPRTWDYLPAVLRERLRDLVYREGVLVSKIMQDTGISREAIGAGLETGRCASATHARLEAYFKGLDQGKFADFESPAQSQKAKRVLRLYLYLNNELWREYQEHCLHPDKFRALGLRQQLVWVNIAEFSAKTCLLAKHKAQIETKRLWLMDGRPYGRWKEEIKQSYFE